MIRFVLLALLLVFGGAPARAELRDLLPFGRTHRLAKVLPTVVNITMIKLVSDGEAGAAPRRVENFGSGFIIDPSGIIATNKHVVLGMSDFIVTMSTGTTFKAKVIGVAGNMDLALLKISSEKPLPSVKWGDSDKVRVGDQVFAVGNPLGVGESVSAGIVSGLNRNIKLSAYDAFIQTDAAINHGNSGGALVDMAGEVVGVNTAIYSPGDTGSIGIGFAIPANDARYVLDQLRQFGRVRLGWLGLWTQEVTADMADGVGLAKARGVIVAQVGAETPAAKAGLREGDVVLSFAGQAPKDGRALSRMVARAKIGVAVPVVVWRDGREVTLRATPSEWADDSDSTEVKAAPVRVGSTDPKALGLQLAAITADAREQFKLAEGQGGVLIAKVQPNTAASDKALFAGDVIVKVQQEAVAAPEDVERRLGEARAAKRSHALVLIRRRDEQQWVSLPIAAAK
jgi:serine protease Do